MKKQFFSIIKCFICLIIFIVFCESCGGSKGRLPSRGEEFKVNEKCFAAVSERAYDELNEIAVRRDEAALIEMMSFSKVYVVDTYDKVIMVDPGFSSSVVKIERNYEYIEVIVDNRFLYQ